jgi:PPOX class probable FMN-dependent enzyme
MTIEAVRSIEMLEGLFGEVGEASRLKEVSALHPVYQAWIEASPFAVMATSGPDGLDVSPRGDPAPLVRVVDPNTLLMPERRGNNRVDSLRNLVHDARVALIFFVPGVGETVRILGTAVIRTDADLLESFSINGAQPRCVIQVQVQAVFFQCARAIKRAGLWDAVSSPARVPTAGDMLAASSQGSIDGAPYDRELPARQAATLY